MVHSRRWMIVTAAAAGFFALTGALAPAAYAHHCTNSGKGSHSLCPPDDQSDQNSFKGKVEFDNLPGDSIQSDNHIFVHEGNNLVVNFPREGTVPGQFLFFVGRNSPELIFINFGDAVDCEDDSFDNNCVVDAGGSRVECPFSMESELRVAPPKLRVEDPGGDPDNTLCAADVAATFTMRDPLIIHEEDEEDEDGFVAGSVEDLGYVLTMVSGEVKQMRADNKEVEFYVPKPKRKYWRIDFDNVSCNVGTPTAANFLDVEAFDTDSGNDIREAWHLSTGAGSKRGCLAKNTHKGNSILIGNFDMRFGLQICLIDESTGDCL